MAFLMALCAENRLDANAESAESAKSQANAKL